MLSVKKMKNFEDTRIVWLFLLQIASFLGIAVLGVFYYDLNEQLQHLKTDTVSHTVSKRSSPSSTMKSEKPAACEMRCQRGRNCQCLPVALSRNDLIRYQLAQQLPTPDVNPGTTSQPRQGAYVGHPGGSGLDNKGGNLDSSTGGPKSDGCFGADRDGNAGRAGATGPVRGPGGPGGRPGRSPGRRPGRRPGRQERRPATRSPGHPEIRPAFPSQSGNQGQSAAAYVQWGNFRCAQDSVSIYGGFIAGPHVTNINEGTDLQCLPRQPDSSTSIIGHRLSTNSDSYIGVVQFDGPPDISASDSVIMCSMCYVPGKSLQVMIPGRVTCPGNLKHVYNGWLMEAGRRSESEERVLSISNQICMARDAESMPGLSDNSTIKLSHVRFGSSCGAAGSPCSSYSDSQAIPCCVCTQKDI